MSATVEFDFVGGAGTIGAGTSAESNMKFSRVDDLSSSTTPVPIPTSANHTAYSFWKPCNFKVTGGTGGNLSNFTIKYDSGPTTGFYLYFKGVAQASYSQSTSGNQIAEGVTTNGEVPTGYTLMTGTAQQWYAGPVDGSTNGLKGDSVYLLLGVGNNYAGGGGSAKAIPNLSAAYDES